MSDLWFNIRFGYRHLQLSNSWELSVRTNMHWVVNKPDKWFQVYTVFGVHFG